MQTLLLLALALFAGLLMTRLFVKFRLPDVTAYLVAGILIGPCVLGRLGVPCLGFNTSEQVDSLSMISDVALGFIAFAIGHEFRLSALKQTGKQATIIGILQAVVATAFVDIALIALHFMMPDLLPMPVAITLGAIAAATAPAATLMVVRQYKAKGPVTDVLLPVVALDDAVGLVIFAVSFGIAQSMKNGTTHIAALIIEPLMEVILSVGFGALVGLGLTWLERFFHSHRNRNALIVGSVVLTVAVSQLKIPIGPFTFGFSSLLVCMMLGTIFCNFCPLSEDLMLQADRWSGPAITLFFVLSGAALDFSVFADLSVVLIGVIYILFRSMGKIIGAHWSSVLAKSPKTVKKYLGITLLPQAGVALGMCSTAYRVLGGVEGTLIRNIVLFSVLIYELVGPSLTKWALTKAGDIQAKSADMLTRRQRRLQEITKPVPPAFDK
ncbi:cation:proton antiporter [Aristaeella hokkaidonensis]|uniref:Cation:proton antiporter n=1 Tax=Aristaeella hokkaidonensis TaxID=3046382 RepID=A0AC61N0G9_9FIRM|nr:cation:proton antiporter [Aristaeella hokkaidonensis]QUC68443.1 cation:proton antiporter [Aristaeella hokkaidonensis]SNT94913.1 transporter, CPA2 family [Aristaeella hokkaidonensis]